MKRFLERLFNKPIMWKDAHQLLSIQLGWLWFAIISYKPNKQK